MQPFPETPTVAEVPDDRLASGHLWLLEHVPGAPLRFRVEHGGLVFGDERTWFDAWDEPLGVRAAVNEVRERFDTDGLAASVEDPTGYEFYGVATRNEGIEYDWDRLPAFLGSDVRGPDGELVPVDTAAGAFERLGLDPLASFEREVPARHFNIERHEVPDSTYYDGPAAGTVVRRKDGARALIPGTVEGDSSPTLDPEAFVDSYVTPDAIDAAVAALGDSPSVDATVGRLLATLVREHYAELDSVDEGALRAAAVERVARRLG